MSKKLSKARRTTAICVVLGCFFIFCCGLVKIQLIDGDTYAAASSSVSENTISIPAARGGIVDRNGDPLIINRQGYSIVFDATYFPPSSQAAVRNNIIDSLITLFEQRKEPWLDNLPLEFDGKGVIKFKADCESEIKTMKSADLLDLNEYAAASNCYDALISRYSLESYAPAKAIKIASVRYSMERNAFRISNPYTFAQDVSDETVALIKENSSFYKGVDVAVVPYREYIDGTLAPHVLGRVGAIDAEEYAKLKSSGYKITDEIGKSGIESAMEEYLRGKSGVKTVYTDAEGKKSTAVTTEPEQGNTVVLTIDAGLQEVTQNALQSAIETYAGLKGNLVDNAGAAVVLDCRTGEILASASYPSYDISTYKENAAALNSAPAAPLWNRALMSTYATGSTMKPSVAIAALEEGVITEETTFYCTGIYNYLGQKFKCEQSHVRQNVNVVNAINESCNIFFYEVSRLLGIEKMNDYRVRLGFGQKTGCELSEADGVLDSPEYRESLGQEWLPGYTIQSAIGQAGNLVSPIQLANYCATIANGGTRYYTHFVKAVKSYDYSETLIEKEPTVAYETGISAKTLDIVKRGMLAVVTTGYLESAFADLPVTAAAKTGTSQEYRVLEGQSVKINNGFLIAFAPYDNPEIAIAIAGEGMGSGSFAGPAAAKIIDYCFSGTDEADKPQPVNELLS